MKPQFKKGLPRESTGKDSSPCLSVGLSEPLSQLGAHLARLSHVGGDETPHASLPVQHILRVARQTGLCETDHCANTLAILALGREVRQQLLVTLQRLHLSETRFLALVSLHALDPMPSNPADLAYHAEATRPSMTEALNQMEAQGWIYREHMQNDRRVVHVHLTEEGRALAARATRVFLEKADELGAGLSAVQQNAFSSLFTRILKTTTRPQP